MPDAAKLKKLQQHAQLFLDSSLWAYTGYFPDDFYGKEATRYYKWSKRAYDLIRDLDK
jgi:hypothetical protein